uniref:Uncharacterized protein n=1 Tax=Hanusia phi TaxID=3032 RepID=A0A7S0H891_9CRYP
MVKVVPMASVDQQVFTVYVGTSPKRARSNRLAVVGGVFLVAMAAVAVLSTQGHHRSTVMTTKATRASTRLSDLTLASRILAAAPKSSSQQMYAMLQQWQDKQVSEDNVRSQMLAVFPKGINTMLQESSSKVCEKKDEIIGKLSSLLEKLTADAIARNLTDAKSFEEKKESLQAWLEEESSFRLEAEKAKEAEQGASYARVQYEKWKASYQDAKQRVEQLEKSYPKELASIAAERALIKEIIVLLDTFESQPTDQAKQTGKSNTLMQIKAKLSKLQQWAQQSNSAVKIQGIKSLEQKLASFTETSAVRTLLQDMLKELDTREQVVKKVEDEAKAEMNSHFDKLVHYEKDVVDLSNAADKAKEVSAQTDMEREKLNGLKKNSAESYEDEHDEYETVAPPAERAIYILQVIIEKIRSFCAAPSASA